MSRAQLSQTRKWIGYSIIGLVVTICAGGWAYIMGNVGQTPGMSSQTIAYRVVSDTSTTITFQIAKPKGDTAVCTARALDSKAREVASVEVTALPGKTTSTQRIDLPTTSRAVSAEVRDCALR